MKRSIVEVYIEVLVYAIFIVFGLELIIDGEENQKIFGVVMIGVSIVKIFLLNRKWNHQRTSNE
jgi:hypothetical protein